MATMKIKINGIWTEIPILTGKSAYASAVSGGFSGTEDDFNASLAAAYIHITNNSIHIQSGATVNGHQLNGGSFDITANEVGAYSSGQTDSLLGLRVSTGTTVNGQSLSSNVSITPSTLGVYTSGQTDTLLSQRVSTGITVNEQTLTSNIIITPSTLGVYTSGQTDTLILDKVDKVLNKSLVFDTEISKIHTQNSDNTLLSPDKTTTIVSTDNAGNLHIYGNIIQSGGTYETHLNHIYTTGDTLNLRNGTVGGLPNGKYAGITIEKYDGTNNGSIEMGNDGLFRIGNSTGVHRVPTIEDTPTNDYLTKYDSASGNLITIIRNTSSIPPSTDKNYVTDSEKVNINYLTGVTSDIQTQINEKVSDSIADGVTSIAPSQNAVFDALASKQNSLAFVTETENKFLRDDNSFQTIEQAVGGYSNNLYFVETASDISGYETLSYVPEVAETIESWTVNSSEGEKLLMNYIYPMEVGTTSIPAGLWSISMFGKVSASAGVTQMGITYFTRHTNGTETDLFTVWSNEINNTIDEWIRFQITNPAFIVVATDRMGARVKIKTTSGTNRTVTYAVGDGYGAFINNPNKIRHNQLRAYNEDITVQHIDANTEKATIIDADSLVIWDSVAVKAVRSTFAHFKTVLQSTFAKLTGGNSFVGNQSINGNVIIDSAGATPHPVWKLVVGDATTDEAKLYVGRTDVINDETVQTYAAVFRMTPNTDPTGVLFSRVNYGGISIGTGTSNGFGIATTDNSGANPVDMIEFGTQGTTATTRWLMLGTGSVYSLDANKIVGSNADTVIQNNALNASRVVARVAGTALQTGDLFDVGILANSTTFNKKFIIDKDGNTTQNNIINRRETQVTAGSTTTLTKVNARTQEFTGTLNQTLVLPVVSTLTINTVYEIVNLSSGIITINSSGGNTVKTLAAGYTIEIKCIAITGTDATSWRYGIRNNGAGKSLVSQLESEIPTGTAPLIVASTTKVTNLNADLLDDLDSSAFAKVGTDNTFTGNQIINGTTGDTVTINNTGTGNCLVVEDSTNPDSTPTVIDASGQVGIGMATPTAPLHVTGLVKIQNGSSTGTLTIGADVNANTITSGVRKLGRVTMPSLTGTTNTSIIDGDISAGGISTVTIGAVEGYSTLSPNEIYFGTNTGATAGGITRMTIKSDGKIGMGISAPTARVHINNTTTDNSLLIEDETSPDSTPTVIDNKGWLGVGTTAPTSPVEIRYQGDDVQPPFFINTSGSALDSQPAFKVRLNSTGTRKAFQFTNSTDPFAWMSCGWNEGGTDKPGLALGPGGVVTRDVTLYRDGAGLLRTNSKLTTEGITSNASVTLPYIEKTADYTLTDSDYTVNCTANTFNITLPTAVGKQGRIYNIKNTGLGTITVNTTSSQTIDGELTQTLVKPTNMQVQSTNANWIIL